MGHILGQLFPELSPKCPKVHYTVGTISSYRDGGSHVLYFYVRLISFIPEQRKRKLFLMLMATGGLPTILSFNYGEFEGCAFLYTVGEACRLVHGRKGTIKRSEGPIV